MSRNLNNVLEHASVYRQKYYDDPNIEKKCNAILKIINMSIKEAIHHKKSKAVISIPTIFDIGYMSNARAQRIIYYRIAECLREKEYTYKFFYNGISAKNQEVLLYITWLTEMDKKFDQHIKEELDKCSELV